MFDGAQLARLIRSDLGDNGFVDVSPMVRTAATLDDRTAARLLRQLLIEARRAGVVPLSCTQLAWDDVACDPDLLVCVLVTLRRHADLENSGDLVEALAPSAAVAQSPDPNSQTLDLTAYPTNVMGQVDAVNRNKRLGSSSSCKQSGRRV